MHGSYVSAIEARLGWLRWLDTPKAQEMFSMLNRDRSVYVPWLARHLLSYGETYFMDSKFCHLVEHARNSIPETLMYEADWLQSENGFLWAAEPIQVPDLKETDKGIFPGHTVLRAVGWRHVPPGDPLIHGADVKTTAPPYTTHFVFFMSFADYLDLSGDPGITAARRGFGVWSYFTLRPGDIIGERVTKFEREMRKANPDGEYVDEGTRRVHRLHEMRWLYTALKLMSQRLTTRIRVRTDRHVRRRAEREGQQAPPYIEVITLRRFRHYAIRTGQAAIKEPVDWKWQWIVRGHWRNQWYPAQGVHRPKFVESYLKGPDEKPIKPSALKLFAARR